MKKTLFHLTLVLAAGMLLTQSAFAQGIGINETGADPHPAAMLDVSSTTKGFLPPRMTTAQRDAIISPAPGLTIYNTTINCLQWWNGTVWYDGCGNNPALTTLNCVGSTLTGGLNNGSVASGVSASVPYTAGNGGSYYAESVSSTGVVGLTATLSAGTLANGDGSLTYTITGTPTTSGTASFAITLGGQSCSFNVSVAAAMGTFPVNTVNCTGATAVVNVTNPTTGRIWMDRNLGATQVATSSTDANSIGDLYQWGRRADGHQCRTSLTTATLSSMDEPAHNLFIKIDAGLNDWRSPQNATLWQGVNGGNNPCPSGYRIPTATEINDERVSWSSQNAAGAFASPLKWPYTGYRAHQDGYIGQVQSKGCYWSSTVGGTGGTWASGTEFWTSGTYTSGQPRAVGNSVRCIKD